VSFRVRTPDGELEYGSLYDIANALRHGLVHAEDEVLAPGQTTWVRVGDHTALRSEVPAPRRGLRIAGGVELIGAVVCGVAGLVGIFRGWNLWMVGAAVAAAVWFSTRVAFGGSRVRPPDRVSSRRR